MPNIKDIVFIHGLFQNPNSWEQWIRFFSEKGFRCHAPAYPFHRGNPKELRETIHPDLGKLSLSTVVESIREQIQDIAGQPLLIGHSMGGLIVQKLIGMKIGSAGICIDSAPPKGIFSFQWSFLRANFPTINPLKGNSICLPSVEWFHYAFCNTMTMEETKREYDLFVVPESRNIPRSSTLKDGTVDFSSPHNPLLFIAGEKDNIIPHTLNLKNYLAYSDRSSIKDFKIFPGRTHYICGQQEWEEVAGYCVEWIFEKVR